MPCLRCAPTPPTSHEPEPSLSAGLSPSSPRPFSSINSSSDEGKPVFGAACLLSWSSPGGCCLAPRGLQQNARFHTAGSVMSVPGVASALTQETSQIPEPTCRFSQSNDDNGAPTSSCHPPLPPVCQERSCGSRRRPEAEGPPTQGLPPCHAVLISAPASHQPPCHLPPEMSMAHTTALSPPHPPTHRPFCFGMHSF